MRVIVLGCGGSAGVPHIGGVDGQGDWGACDPADPRNVRTRSSIVIEGPDGRILVDTGPDLRTQLLACRVPRIDAFIFTHAHADHITGLDDTRILNRIAGHPLPAYATETTLKELEQRFDYAFRPWKPPMFYRPVLDTVTVAPGETHPIAGLPVTLFEQDHHVMPTLGAARWWFRLFDRRRPPRRGRTRHIARRGHLARRLFPAPTAPDPRPHRPRGPVAPTDRRQAYRAHAHGQ